MTTSYVTFPPIAKISMIGIWVETVLYGVNCVMYGLCMHILLRERKAGPLRWVLVVMSTILFLLCTAHVGASLQQLLDAFIYAPADVPDYFTTYWFDFTTVLRMLKDNLYITLVLAQDFILIWRLYSIFMGNWRIITLPIALAAGCVGSAYAASALSARPNYGEPATASLVLSAWVFGFALNVFVTLTIAGRLWWMGRRMAALTSTSSNRFASSIYIIVESGALSAVVNTVVLALFANPLAFSGLDVASQLIALTPLLIIVQLGLTGRYGIPRGDTSKTVPTVHDEIVFRGGIPPEQESQNDLTLRTISSRSGHDALV